MTLPSDPFDEDDEQDGDPEEDPDWCPRCQGTGKVTTADYESYFGANYKPCPLCGGDPCIGEPRTS
jgi:DnaJ-class molecular chaperone